MNQRQNLAASYTALDGYASRAGAAQTSRPGPPSPREDLGGPRPIPAQEKSEDWGMSAAGRAHNLPPYPCTNVSQNAAENTSNLPLRSGRADAGAPEGGARVRGLRSCGMGDSVLRSFCIVDSAFFVQNIAPEYAQRVHEAECGTCQGLKGEGGQRNGGKCRTTRDHVLSPFGRL